MAPVQDTISSAATQVNGEYVLVAFAVILGGFLLISVLGTLLNKYLKQYNENCDEEEVFWFPIAHIGCFFCRLIKFFMPRLWKKVHKKYSDKHVEKCKKRQQLFEEKIKERTKGLTEL